MHVQTRRMKDKDKKLAFYLSFAIFTFITVASYLRKREGMVSPVEVLRVEREALKLVCK